MAINTATGMRKLFFIYLIFFLTSTTYGFVSEVDELHPFSLSFDDTSSLVVEAGQVTVPFFFQIPSRHHLYKESFRVDCNSPGVKAEVILPEGIWKFDDFAGGEVEIFENELVVTVKLSFADGVQKETGVMGDLWYQGCSSQMCFRAVKVPFQISVNSSEMQGEPAPKPMVILDFVQSGWRWLTAGDFSSVLMRGFWFSLLVTFLAGVVTGFTPCVLPVIPLTLAFIGVNENTRWRARLLHLGIFVLGMSFMYTSLGLSAAVLGKSFGFLFQNRIFLFLVVVFLVVMALEMFGLVTIALPVRLQTAIVRYQPKGWWRHFYAGLTIGVLAAPCVSPVLGPLLVYVVATRDLVLGFVMTFFYAIGLGVVFVVLGFFSGAGVACLGSKTVWVKRFVGLLLLGTALYFGVGLVKSFWLDKSQKADFFYQDLDKAIKMAKNQHKGILVDFYADWCVPCHEWERNVWSSPAVQKRIERDSVPVKINCTTETTSCREAIDLFKVVGWPTILFLNESGEEIVSKRIVGRVLSAQEFLEFLDEI